MRKILLIASVLLSACSRERARVAAPKSDDIILITIDTRRQHPREDAVSRSDRV